MSPGNDAVWPHSQRKGAHREDPSADETRAAARQRSARLGTDRHSPERGPGRADGCGRPAAHLHPGRHLPSRSAVAHPEPVRARPRTVEEESDSAVSPCGARLESNRRAHRYHRCAGGSRFRAAPHAPTHPRPVTGSRRSPSGRCWVGCRRRGPAPGRAVCLGQHRGVDRVAEGTRGGVWAETPPQALRPSEQAVGPGAATR